MSSEKSPLCRRWASKWQAVSAQDGLWHIRDDEGHELRQHFFTAESAQAYAQRLA
jgi:hypothetical protein